MGNISVDRSSVRCEVVSDFHRLQELSQDWTRLWQSDPQAEVFQTPEWAFAWWSTFGHDFTLCSLVVFADEQVVGIVPLVKRGGVIQFLGTPEADYADIICEDEWTEQVLAVAFQTLRQSVSDWNECVWQHLSKDSRVMRHYPALPRQALGTLQCLPSESYQTILLCEDSRSVLGSLLRKKHTRRRQNKLRKAGQVRFRNVHAQEGMQYLDEFFDHHVRRHAALGRRSLYAAPDARQFIRTLFTSLGSVVRFGVLELDGRPLAWHLGFEVNGKFLLYQHTFDLEASRYTPGEVLLWNLFEYAQDHVAREFDFGSGSEPYKNRFANYSRETFSLFIEPLGWSGRRRAVGRKLQSYVLPRFREVQQLAKSSRTVMRAFRSVRTWGLNLFGPKHIKKTVALKENGVRLTQEESVHPRWRKRSSPLPAAEISQPETKASAVGVHE
jgi:CelD/BcsL family acetyltransferase involved in cellulose biosynthesis